PARHPLFTCSWQAGTARQISMPGKDNSRMRAIFEQELSQVGEGLHRMATQVQDAVQLASQSLASADLQAAEQVIQADDAIDAIRSEEHTSELQSRFDLVCR